MNTILEFIEKIIGHLAWPSVIVVISLFFRKEMKSILKRVKSAEIKDVKFELEEKIDEVRKDAINYGVTMFYPTETLQREFNSSGNLTNEMQLLDSWKKIEKVLVDLDDRTNKNNNTNDSLNYLVKTGIVENGLAKLIYNLRDLRNRIAHEENVNIFEEDYQNWISISKSIIDRLDSKRGKLGNKGEFRQCPNGHYYQGTSCPYCKK